MQTVPVQAAPQDFGDTVMTSLTGAMAMFFSAIPRILAFIVILVIGWFIASLIAKGVMALCRAVNLNDMAERSGLAGFVDKMGVKSDTAGLIANAVKWFVRLIALVVAFDALGLSAVSVVLQQFLLWIPQLVVAIVVLVIAGLLAAAIGKLVRGSAAKGGFSNPELLATVAMGAVWAFGIIVAVNQVGIAEALVNTLLIGVIGALALASGLAFGLGGKEKAAQLLTKASEAATEAAPKAAKAAQSAKEQAAQAAQSAKEQTGRQPSAYRVEPSPMRADDPRRDPNV